MPIRRNKLYLLLTIASLAGYSWLFINHSRSAAPGSNETGVCLIKEVTHIPCPSCGATRAVLSLLEGHFIESLRWNPLGVILLLILVITPLWLAFDLFSGRDSLICFYTKMETVLQQKWVAIPAIGLVLGNWIWNIFKGL